MIINEIIKARANYLGKHKRYPKELLLRDTHVLDEIILEYKSMRMSWKYNNKICGVPFKVDDSIELRFEFRGLQPDWADEDE